MSDILISTTSDLSKMITDHFSWKEFECHDGTQVPVQFSDNVILLCRQLEIIRTYVKEPLIILSGFRSVDYNRCLHAKDDRVAIHSQHLVGKAADIKCKHCTPFQLYNIIEHLIDTGKILQGGLGLYYTFVHYDIRGNAARWNYSV